MPNSNEASKARTARTGRPVSVRVRLGTADKGGCPSAIVLAAGTSSRFAGGTKQLAKMGGKAILEMVLEAIPPRRTSETIVVLGHNARKIERALPGRRNVRIVINEDYRDGVGRSISVGVRALTNEAAGALLILGDQPLLTRPFLYRILKEFGEQGNRKIIATSYGDIVGPPVVFPRACFEELAGLRGDRGARSVIDRHYESVVHVPLDSTATVADIDTREDLATARRLLPSRRR